MPAQNIGKMIGFVSKTKRSGLDYDVLSAIAQQNIDAAAWLTEHSELLTLVCRRASAALAERFEEEVERACGMAPVVMINDRPVKAVLNVLDTGDLPRAYAAYRSTMDGLARTGGGHHTGAWGWTGDNVERHGCLGKEEESESREVETRGGG